MCMFMCKHVHMWFKAAGGKGMQGGAEAARGWRKDHRSESWCQWKASQGHSLGDNPTFQNKMSLDINSAGNQSVTSVSCGQLDLLPPAEVRRRKGQ